MMSGFNEWFKQYLEILKEYNVEPDEDMLWDTWQESKKQAIERTKAACVEAVKRVDGWSCETGEYYLAEWVVEKQGAIDAINNAEVK
jgi:hypothetical protein